jgi:NarL family two-component system response regulator YdfI
MIRVLVKASSPIAKAGLESLLGDHPALRLVQDTAGDIRGMGAESPADVLLVEAGTLADPAARKAMDWAAAGGPVVMLVHNPAVEPVAEALRAGLKAVLSNGGGSTQIAAAIVAAAAGLVVVDAADVEALLRAPNSASRHGSEALVEALTAREVEVLQLLASGLGNKEIASRLRISEHTVKFHVASIMGKLGAASRTEAVTVGIRRGLIMI